MSMSMSNLRRRATGTKWRLDPPPSSFAPKGSFLSNRDMDPVPLAERTWTTLDYCTYWLSDAFSTATWSMASSIIAGGLSYRQALPIIAIGFIIISAPITLNGTTGAQTHLPFPVLNRSSFGFWLSYFSVVSRVVLASFWFGMQTYVGGECVYQMIRAIWPSFRNVHNGLPESADITSAQMLCYLLFWLFQLPFVMIGPQRLRYLFLAKALICPATGIAMMAWALHKGSSNIFAQRATLTGSAFTYTWLSGMNSVIGNFATLSVNIPDFTRYAVSPRHQYVQLIIIPVAFTFVAFMGVVVTSAGYELYGEFVNYWDPLRLINNWDNRAATFFASASFMLATLGTNISANSVSGANDLTAMAPRYINIKRGSFLVALIGGWAIPSWKILNSASGFLSFVGLVFCFLGEWVADNFGPIQMSGYTVFLGPFAGIMIADYYIVKKGRLDIPSLYNPAGRYYYTAGCNWRAAVALLISITPNLPGLAKTITPSLSVPLGFQHLYSVAWLYGFFCAAFLYTTLSLLFPAHESLGGDTVWGKNENEGISEGSSSGGGDDEEKVKFDDN